MSAFDAVVTLLRTARAKKHAVELYQALCDLSEDTQHSHHLCGDPDCPVIKARRVIDLVEGRTDQPDEGLL